MSETQQERPSIYDEVAQPAADEAGTEEKPAVDVEAIVPSANGLKVTIDGQEIDCQVRRLKTREFLALLNVLTNGLGPSLGQVQIDLSDPESIQRDLSALMLLALPNAVGEFMLFLREVVEPKDPRNQAVVANYMLDNPDLDVMVDVFEHVAVQEKDDLAVLAGKAQAMWSRLSKVYGPK